MSKGEHAGVSVAPSSSLVGSCRPLGTNFSPCLRLGCVVRYMVMMALRAEAKECDGNALDVLPFNAMARTSYRSGMQGGGGVAMGGSPWPKAFPW